MRSARKQDKDEMRLEPLAVGREEAARLIDVPISSFDAMLSSGQIGPQGVKLGKRRLFPVEELQVWVRLGMPPRDKFNKLREQEGRRS